GADRPATLGDLEPLVRGPGFMHNLLDVQPGRIVFSTNRRNGVDLDVVVLDRESGEEFVAYDGGGYVVDAQVAPSGSQVAVTRLSEQPCSTQVSISVADGVAPITDADDHALHSGVRWLPDG